MRKEAIGLWPIPAVLGGLSAGVAIYDLIKGAKVPTLTVKDLRGVKKSQVDPRVYVKELLERKPLRKPPVVVSSLDHLPLLMKGENLTPEELGEVQSILKRGTNACALRGEKNDYLILPNPSSRELVEHEVGHLREREKGPAEAPSLLEQLAAGVWKPTYSKYVMDPEEKAWSHVEHPSDLRERALATYEKPFHRNRAGLMGTLAAAFLLSALGTAAV